MDGANPGLVVFDHEIPEELVRDLNDSYSSVVEPESLWPTSSIEPLMPETTTSQGSTWKLKLSLVLISPILTFLLAIIINGLEASDSDPIVSEPVSTPVPPPTTPQYHNLALASEDASILHGFTSPPALSSWIPWSRLFEVEAESLLRPHTGTCWPVESDGAVGIGLGRTALVSAVHVNMKEPYTAADQEQAKPVALPQTQVSIYGINDNGEQYLIAKSPPNSASVSLSQPILLSSLIVRTQITWTTDTRYACIDSIEVLGIPN